MKNTSSRYQTGLDYLAMIEGQWPPSLEANLKDIAPDLARLAIEFAYGEIYPRQYLDLRNGNSPLLARWRRREMPARN